jgi:hypothetical protein
MIAIMAVNRMTSLTSMDDVRKRLRSIDGARSAPAPAATLAKRGSAKGYLSLIDLALGRCERLDVGRSLSIASH